MARDHEPEDVRLALAPEYVNRSVLLFYDTETNGIPLYKEPSEDPRQPHIVQLSAMLVDASTRAVLNTLDLIVKPDGWEISPEMTAIHGISQEQAMDVGVPEEQALETFFDLWGAPREHMQIPRYAPRVAHNEPFDARIIRIAIKRLLPLHGWEQDMADEVADTFRAAPRECSMRMATPILKLPPSAAMKAKKMNFPKSPNLQEAHEYFFGPGRFTAHNARADAQACMEVYFACKDGRPAFAHRQANAVAAIASAQSDETVDFSVPL